MLNLKVVFELKHKSIILINSPKSKHNYTVLNMTDVSKCQFYFWCQSSVISLLNIGYLLFCFPGTLSCHGCLGVCKHTNCFRKETYLLIQFGGSLDGRSRPAAAYCSPTSVDLVDMSITSPKPRSTWITYVDRL